MLYSFLDAGPDATWNVAISTKGKCELQKFTNNVKIDARTVSTTQEGQENVSQTVGISSLFRAMAHIDSEHVEIARRIPGYGGHYFDSAGSMVVYLKDLERAGEARALMAERMRGYRGQGFTPNGSIQFRPADFDFNTLTHWRTDVLPAAIGHLPGVRLIGTSKRLNRINIGVENNSSKEEILSELDRRGVPAAAVVFMDVQFEAECDPEMALEECDDGSGGGSGGGSAYWDSLTIHTNVLQAGRRIYTEQT